jgi:putative copper export protein
MTLFPPAFILPEEPPMHTLAKIVHVLSLGLWSGAITFFSFFTALPIIRRMEQFATSKPDWLPGLTEKEQGTRLAGEALSDVFSRYFFYQLVCGALALITAALWMRMSGAIHKVRVVLLVIAVALVLVNTFVLYPRVSQLRVERYAPDPAVAKQKSDEFGQWHTYSLGADMLVLVLVLVVLGMAVALPARPEP